MVFRRLRRCAVLALALFAAVCATEQLEHHDIACHLKSPQHCSACAASPPGADPHTPALLDRAALTDAGTAVADPLVIRGTLLPVRCSGRAPPVFL